MAGFFWGGIYGDTLDQRRETPTILRLTFSDCSSAELWDSLEAQRCCGNSGLALRPGYTTQIQLAMSLTGRFQKALERRWVLVLLAALIGPISGLLLWITLQNAYWDYWLAPKLKAPDHYIYPELRYTFFDIVLLLWCLDGLVVSGLSAWSAMTSRNTARWTYRAIAVYCALFAVLIVGGSLMLYVRSRGF